MRRRIIHSSTVDFDGIAGSLNRGWISPNAAFGKGFHRGQTRSDTKPLVFEHKRCYPRLSVLVRGEVGAVFH
jgi:hypothetical protein